MPYAIHESRQGYTGARARARPQVEEAASDTRVDTERTRQRQRYYTVPNPGDRLFVPPEFVPLFVHVGW